jgi:hypothetical protein
VTDLDEEQPVPTFGEAVAAFETVQCYMTSFPIDDSCEHAATDTIGEGVALLSDVSNKTDNSSRLLQEVTHQGMYACIIFYFIRQYTSITGMYVVFTSVVLCKSFMF